MEDNMFTERSTREELYRKLKENFDGKIVRKDLTKRIKEGANVPVYVLEFLLGQYCSNDDEDVVQDGVEQIKRILSENYVCPDESEKVLSKLRQRGSMSIIDRMTVILKAMKRGSQTSVLAKCLFQKTIRRNMIDSCAVVSGVS